jgi:hypothetical protein
MTGSRLTMAANALRLDEGQAAKSHRHRDERWVQRVGNRAY